MITSSSRTRSMGCEGEARLLFCSLCSSTSDKNETKINSIVLRRFGTSRAEEDTDPKPERLDCVSPPQNSGALRGRTHAARRLLRCLRLPLVPIGSAGESPSVSRSEGPRPRLEERRTRAAMGSSCRRCARRRRDWTSVCRHGRGARAERPRCGGAPARPRRPGPSADEIAAGGGR